MKRLSFYVLLLCLFFVGAPGTLPAKEVDVKTSPIFRNALERTLKAWKMQSTVIGGLVQAAQEDNATATLDPSNEWCLAAAGQDP